MKIYTLYISTIDEDGRLSAMTAPRTRSAVCDRHSSLKTIGGQWYEKRTNHQKNFVPARLRPMSPTEKKNMHTRNRLTAICLGLLTLLFSLHSTASEANTLLFIGSSTMEFWTTAQEDFPSYQVVNVGKGGTDYRYLVENAESWAKQYPASGIVIYSGDNDITNGDSAQTVAGNFAATVEILHRKLPNAKIFVISVKPCPAPDRWKNIGEIRLANSLIKKEAGTLGYVTFVDIFGSMLDGSGKPSPKLFREDGVHMTRDGYLLWKKILQEKIDGRGLASKRSR